MTAVIDLMLFKAASRRIRIIPFVSMKVAGKRRLGQCFPFR